tara:strand:- start:267 stop:488 length:222 start_codon:yes stop_codon:yes gene_type:complete
MNNMETDNEGVLHHEFFGVTITKELHFNSKGLLRWAWVLRDAKGHPCHFAKTKEDLITDMMYDSIRLAKMEVE